MRIVGKTDIGVVRHQNQDAYSAGELPGGVAWAVVCDGMGGANGGDIASTTAVKVISSRISKAFRGGMSASSIHAMLESAINAANISVYDMSQEDETLAGMGSTVVACVIVDGVAHIAHAGDSRAYIFSTERIEQITRDHTYVQRLIEDGTLTSEQAKTYPHRHVITRALGVNERLAVDYTDVELTADDAILLCTDGLSGTLEDSDMLKIFSECTFYEYPDRLVSAANSRGGNDNITVVIMSLL